MDSADTDETAPDRRSAGFKDRTRITDARERLLDAATPHDRTERLSLTRADGRALAAPPGPRAPLARGVPSDGDPGGPPSVPDGGSRGEDTSHPRDHT